MNCDYCGLEDRTGEVPSGVLDLSGRRPGMSDVTEFHDKPSHFFSQHSTAHDILQLISGLANLISHPNVHRSLRKQNAFRRNQGGQSQSRIIKMRRSYSSSLQCIVCTFTKTLFSLLK
ncbi:unnamed protein product [Litomosoides sigmodontis]|uniref:Uncharacterized protein n=1 Tax=Litomosoides sigmodontis TaxID=42156 RepID=A0A3P6U0Q4_LITSI|nr:unnamed protein product [Litomosoides sigmodontis]